MDLETLINNVESEALRKTKDKIEVNSKGVHYRTLNEIIKRQVDNGVNHIVLKNVNGQRYIGTGLSRPVKIDIYGTPGEDLASFNSGSIITVYGNAQNAIANTMDSGLLIVHGHAGDVCGYGMRGGKVFIKGNVGYRVAIHMKAYRDKIPLMVIGGKAHNFLGEYMAGGKLIVLALGEEQADFKSYYVGTGMHGGVIYLRGSIEQHQLGKEVASRPLEEADYKILKENISEFCKHFGYNKLEQILNSEFTKLIPVSHRPYGRLYAY